jgi:inner membrane transporter RhtA
MVSLLPATAVVIGVVVLAQVPTQAEMAGVALVIVGVALHRDRPRRKTPSAVRASSAAGDSEVHRSVEQAVP